MNELEKENLKVSNEIIETLVKINNVNERIIEDKDTIIQLLEDKIEIYKQIINAKP